MRFPFTHHGPFTPPGGLYLSYGGYITAVLALGVNTRRSATIKPPLRHIAEQFTSGLTVFVPVLATTAKTARSKFRPGWFRIFKCLFTKKAPCLHPVTAPDFVVTYEQKDITADIAPYLLSWTYTDYLSDQSDELQVWFEVWTRVAKVACV